MKIEHSSGFRSRYLTTGNRVLYDCASRDHDRESCPWNIFLVSLLCWKTHPLRSNCWWILFDDFEVPTAYVQQATFRYVGFVWYCRRASHVSFIIKNSIVSDNKNNKQRWLVWALTRGLCVSSSAFNQVQSFVTLKRNHRSCFQTGANRTCEKWEMKEQNISPDKQNAHKRGSTRYFKITAGIARFFMQAWSVSKNGERM